MGLLDNNNSHSFKTINQIPDIKAIQNDKNPVKDSKLSMYLKQSFDPHLSSPFSPSCLSDT